MAALFWDKISPVYDLFETLYNRKVYLGTGEAVAAMLDSRDEVLECACGTGAISRALAARCQSLVATDVSEGMLRQAAKKLKDKGNVTVEKADMLRLPYANGRFDKLVAGNVIHLLPEPESALQELECVLKPGGRIILPTYINLTKKSNRAAASLLGWLGADFQRQFDQASYQDFLEEMGYRDVQYTVIEGRMLCAIAVIAKRQPECKSEIKV